MMELTEQVAVFLDGKGFGTFDKSGYSGNIFINAMPQNPNNAIAIRSTGGPTADKRGKYGQASIQLIIRSIPHDPRQAESLAADIIQALHGFNSSYLADGGNYIIDTTAQQAGPSNIGQDENNRFEFSQNFIIEYAN